MYSLILAFVKAITGGMSIFQSERALYNQPELVKAKLAQAKQDAQDAINEAESKLADPNASISEHRDALRQIRLAGS